jgi:hypothetical protein
MVDSVRHGRFVAFQDLHMISNVRTVNQIRAMACVQNKTGQILHYLKGLAVSVLVDDGVVDFVISVRHQRVSNRQRSVSKHSAL